MFLDTDSIVVNGVSMGQYLSSATYSFNKLWGTDTGRNLAGEFNGTLLGIFPKIELNFRKLTTTEIQTLAPIFDSATQTTTYYDPVKQEEITMTTYTGDWSINYTYFGVSENTKISLISVSRRS